ncbi:solute carrier family 10 (sodium/bile acid cotransporter), member 7 [Catalinimonas alkaloidigena]|uniref:Solute carrier family 10 (Sodium/bile acid cotransporter), member 7 n=1 Tax=Catalinimonas alkaloidigena TaxID=1075417 RepID=A0A1G9SD49_9BACT|nr:bile acid:sodium symporter family protein [Catalinimonas alkaloidigena]SDM33369.1 solute carrier family 10 (sodium/bile acid cotransporter), member 7 [Catalinimonas alkaloidigena]
MRNVKLDGFIIALVGMIVLAYLIPTLGDFLPLQAISTYGVAGIFFFYGLKLSPRKMKEGLHNWKLHLLIQASTFLLFPLLVLLFRPLISHEEGQLLWLAVFFLAALPSTVSSSVVMVSIAEGNIPAAIFNASISGLIGIVVTPLWMSLFLQGAQAGFDYGDVVVKLLVQILLPVFLGLLLHRFLGTWASHYKKQLNLFDKSIILLIVYNSFSESFTTGVFQSIDLVSLGVVACSAFALFGAVYGLIYVFTSLLGFTRDDRITALFCGSKKSLVHGTVFSNVLFTQMASASIFLVPLMFYHAFQLLVVSVIAQRMSSARKPAPPLTS